MTTLGPDDERLPGQKKKIDPNAQDGEEGVAAPVQVEPVKLHAFMCADPSLRTSD